MNTLRKINNKNKVKYEVLFFPHHEYDTGIELLLGNWTSPDFSDFKVKEYDNLQEALKAVTETYLDINFDQLVLFHKEIANDLYSSITKTLEKLDIKYTLKSKLLNSHELKNILFEKIKHKNEDFRLLYDMTNIISFNITCSSVSRQFLQKVFIAGNEIKNFNILYVDSDPDFLKLIGKTDIGTVYEINILY